MSDEANPGETVLRFSWPGLNIKGCTIGAVFGAYGAEPLITIGEWKKLPVIHPGVKEAIEAFLELPRIKPQADEARRELERTRSLKKKPPAGNWAQAERQREMGFR